MSHYIHDDSGYPGPVREGRFCGPQCDLFIDPTPSLEPIRIFHWWGGLVRAFGIEPRIAQAIFVHNLDMEPHDIFDADHRGRCEQCSPEWPSVFVISDMADFPHWVGDNGACFECSRIIVHTMECGRRFDGEGYEPIAYRPWLYISVRDFDKRFDVAFDEVYRR